MPEILVSLLLVTTYLVISRFFLPALGLFG